MKLIPPLDHNASPLLTPTPRERFTSRPAVVFSFFFLVLAGSEFTKAGLLLAARFLPMSMTSANLLLVQLFITSVTVAAVLLWCLLGERRSLASMGFSPRVGLWEYPVGLVAGLFLLATPLLLCVVTGTATVTIPEVYAPEASPSAGLLLLFFVAFLIQGMSEELLCRSYLMVSLSRGWPLWSCAVANALLFTLLHLGNPGISVIPLVNIFLFGLFASFLTLRRGSVWMVGAIHSMWNFAQGNLFGIPVSGLSGIPAPLSTTLESGGLAPLWNGGVFGLEGGLAVTLTLILATLLTLLLPTGRAGKGREA